LQPDVYLGLNEKVLKMLEGLKDSNTYYAHAKGEDFFQKIKNGQHPKATLLGCSDARFRVRSTDATTEDDVFVVRNIGNQFIIVEGSIAC
jgi:carbonic anhydrase